MMKKSAAFLATVLFAMLASTVYAQSLGDLANKEKERRRQVKNEKVITDEEAAKYRSGSETPAATPDQPSGKKEDSEKKGGEAAKSQSENPELNEPADFQGRPESYWRKTMAEARQKVKDLEKTETVLTLKQNDLHNQFYREDNGFRREEIEKEIQKTFYEQDVNKENLAKARDALRELENEARKSGALPGWLEDRNPQKSD